MYQVEHLKINFKTVEEFKVFKQYGLQQLSMLEDLQANMIENNCESPFYGIYYGNKLVARMSLYKRCEKNSQYFGSNQEYLELAKLEVLPEYQRKGLGSTLVSYAKSLGLPIKTIARIKSKYFWEKHGFFPVSYKIDGESNSTLMIWLPNGETGEFAKIS